MGLPIIRQRRWKVEPWILPCSRKSISNSVATTVECNYRLNHVARPRACNLERIPGGGSRCDFTDVTHCIVDRGCGVPVSRHKTPPRETTALIFHFPLLIDPLGLALLISSSTLIDLERLLLLHGRCSVLEDDKGEERERERLMKRISFFPSTYVCSKNGLEFWIF